MTVLTKSELKQYRSICAEIQEINIKLKDKEVYGAVRGSESEFPYTEHIMSVSGVKAAAENRRLLARRKWLIRQKEDIEEFIENIEDSLTRRIFEKMYIEGDTKPTWVKVAMDIGGGNTQDGIRKIHDRFLDKKEYLL